MRILSMLLRLMVLMVLAVVITMVILIPLDLLLSFKVSPELMPTTSFSIGMTCACIAMCALMAKFVGWVFGEQ